MNIAADQKRRHRHAQIIGPVAAFVIAGLASGLLFGGRPGSLAPENSWPILVKDVLISTLPFGLAAALAAWVCIRLIWVRAMRHKESRKRGFWFGVLTGCAALIVMMYLVVWGVGILETVDNRAFNVSSSAIMAMLFGPLIMSAFGFIIGGFLALPAGGWLGWFFSRNPET